VLVMYFHPDTRIWRHVTLLSFARVLVLGVVIVVPASALVVQRLPRLAGRAYLAFLLFVAFFLLVRLHLVLVWLYEIDDMAFILLAVFVLAAAAVRVPRIARAAVVSAGALLLVAMVATHRGRHRNEALQVSRFVHHVLSHWVEPARMLDEPRRPHIIAVAHGPTDLVDTGLFYFLIGRKLQNRLVYVSLAKDEGEVLLNPWNAFQKVSYELWVERLLERGVEYVLTLDSSPLEQSWMERHPDRFTRLWGAPNQRGLYRVLRDEEVPPAGRSDTIGEP
jgi:hypothetical protein